MATGFEHFPKADALCDCELDYSALMRRSSSLSHKTGSERRETLATGEERYVARR